jgi:probable addiction module antidote protein
MTDMASKPKKSKPYDPAKYLDSDAAVAEYITEALATGDVELVSHAIGVAAKARGMTRIAEETGLSRESLYRALSAEGRPQFETIERVLGALGLRLRAEPVAEADKRRPKGKRAA